METNENGQAGLEGRLVIERMVLTNFKSYAGEKVIGPFHKVQLASQRHQFQRCD